MKWISSDSAWHDYHIGRKEAMTSRAIGAGKLDLRGAPQWFVKGFEDQWHGRKPNYPSLEEER